MIAVVMGEQEERGKRKEEQLRKGSTRPADVIIASVGGRRDGGEGGA